MAITIGATKSIAQTSIGPVTDASVTHTVDVGSDLLVVTTMYEAAETVTATPQWSGNGTPQNLTLVDATTPSGSQQDVALETWALVSPTAEVAGTVTVTQSSNDVFVTTAVNYLGTVISSVAAAIQFIEELVHDGGGETDNLAFASGGTAGNTLYATGVLQGGDGDGITVPTNFTEIQDGSTGGSGTSDISYYLCDFIGGAASACTITWTATDSNAGHYLQIVPLASASTTDVNYSGLNRGIARGIARGVG